MFLAVSLALTTLLALWLKDGWALLVMVLTSLLVVHIYTNTLYVIKGNHLIVKSSVFTKTININDITTIANSNALWSAPALSLDRLKVVDKNNRSILISPKEKASFINTLLTINPNIQRLN